MIHRVVKVAFGLLVVGLTAWYTSAVCACGGLFSPESQLAQNAERIIFTDNGDGTISAIIQIEYTGHEENFSWILPIPEAIPAEAIEVPETAQAAFQALELATRPIYRDPQRPLCMAEFDLFTLGSTGDGARAGNGVDVFSSGIVGPYGFDVISSADPTALIDWLREHGYQVTAAMEPLINAYVQEGMYFLAMQLAPEAGIQDIQPVKLTFQANRPMIPIRIAAVAAQPNTEILVWFFASAQAVPANYAAMQIAEDELTFYSEDFHNYETLLRQRSDEFQGQAFITEYAQPTRANQFADPLLAELSQQHPYLTRLRAILSPEEMTVDPMFDYDPAKANVDNIHNLQDVSGLYECERNGTNTLLIGGLIGGISLTAVAFTAVAIWFVRRRL
jgi:hypothetical protein